MPLRILTVCALLAMVGTALAYEVTGRYDHGKDVQINLRCKDGTSKTVTHYKASGNYCTQLGTCGADFDKIAREACGEYR